MDLFDTQTPRQILPRDGIADYYGAILSDTAADAYFTTLMQEIDWQPDRIKLYGKQIVTRREVAWHGDKPYRYTYSHSTKTALPWTPTLAGLKAEVEAASGTGYNCCLLNLYHSGETGMAWHADDENLGWSAILALGSFSGGRFALRSRGSPVEYNIADRILCFDSRLQHRALPHQSYFQRGFPTPTAGFAFSGCAGSA